MGESVSLTVSRAGVALVLLNRPERKNAFDELMVADLSETFDALHAAEGVRLVLLKGAGGTFCAGADIAWMERQGRHDREDNEVDAMALAQMLNKLATLPQLTVALVEGAAFGGGLGLIAACDHALAVNGTKFCFSEARLGLTPATISPYVVAAIGARNAKRLFATAALFETSHAYDIGLIDEVVLDNNALAQAEERLAKDIMACAPGAVAEAKKLVDDVADKPVDYDMMRLTAHRIADRRASEEGREGLDAFLNKRKPSWAE